MRVVFCLLLLVIYGCGKDEKYCWNLYDVFGNFMQEVCDKTAAEMLATYPNGGFERKDEKVLCWKIGNSNNNIIEATTSFVKFVYPGRYEETQCVPCEVLRIRERHYYIPGGTNMYTMEKQEKMCGDSLTLMLGSEPKIIRQSADSIIYIEARSENGTWR